MTPAEAHAALLALPNGPAQSRPINGHAVTRWATGVVEVHAWGRATTDFAAAAEWLAANPAPGPEE
jgi:hypothetical protein